MTVTRLVIHNRPAISFDGPNTMEQCPSASTNRSVGQEMLHFS